MLDCFCYILSCRLIIALIVLTVIIRSFRLLNLLFCCIVESLNYFTLQPFIDAFLYNTFLQMNNKVAKFDKFIKDNDAKRRRAIQKYQIEVLLKEQKQTEYEQLCEQLAALKRRSVKQKISL